MTSQQEVDEALESIESYIKSIGDEIEKDISDLTKEARSEDADYVDIGGVNIKADTEAHLGGYICSHGSNQYIVLASEDQDFIRIYYVFNLLYEIASVLSDEQAADLLGEDMSTDNEVEDELPEYKLDAAHEFLKSINDDHMRQLRFYLGDKLSASSVAYSIETGPSEERREEGNANYVYGYNVTKKLYPYQDEVTVTDFNNAVQSVVSIGFKGARYLSHAFIFDLAEEEERTTVAEKIDISSG